MGRRRERERQQEEKDEQKEGGGKRRGEEERTGSAIVIVHSTVVSHTNSPTQHQPEVVYSALVYMSAINCRLQKTISVAQCQLAKLGITLVAACLS